MIIIIIVIVIIEIIMMMMMSLELLILCENFRFVLLHSSLKETKEKFDLCLASCLENVLQLNQFLSASKAGKIFINLSRHFPFALCAFCGVFLFQATESVKSVRFYSVPLHRGVTISVSHKR